MGCVQSSSVEMVRGLGYDATMIKLAELTAVATTKPSSIHSADVSDADGGGAEVSIVSLTPLEDEYELVKQLFLSGFTNRGPTETKSDNRDGIDKIERIYNSEILKEYNAFKTVIHPNNETFLWQAMSDEEYQDLCENGYTSYTRAQLTPSIGADGIDGDNKSGVYKFLCLQTITGQDGFDCFILTTSGTVMVRHLHQMKACYVVHLRSSS
jgi:hypothetical protein